jgi:hypothetical protein
LQQEAGGLLAADAPLPCNNKAEMPSEWVPTPRGMKLRFELQMAPMHDRACGSFSLPPVPCEFLRRAVTVQSLTLSGVTNWTGEAFGPALLGEVFRVGRVIGKLHLELLARDGANRLPPCNPEGTKCRPRLQTTTSWASGLKAISLLEPLKHSSHPNRRF